MTCQSDDVDLSGAVPTQGYSVDVDKTGPSEVRVFFTSGESEIEVRVECEAVRRKPTFVFEPGERRPKSRQHELATGFPSFPSFRWFRIRLRPWLSMPSEADAWDICNRFKSNVNVDLGIPS